MLEYLTKEQFLETSGAIAGGHWATDALHLRWQYHEQAIRIIQKLNIELPARVLEIGTMGVSLVHGSHTLDYAEKWNFPGKHPTYMHDARRTPWPIHDKSYDIVVALRVFQHLTPVQHACFLEAKRIANNVLLVCPERYETNLNPWSQGILFDEFVSWNENTPPARHQPTEMGALYFWDEKSLPPDASRLVRSKSRVLYDAYRVTAWARRNGKRILNIVWGAKG